MKYALFYAVCAKNAKWRHLLEQNEVLCSIIFHDVAVLIGFLDVQYMEKS
jgi:hypothetical protein